MVCGSRQAWSTAQGLGPCLLGVRGFESHFPHKFKNYKDPILTTFVKKTIIGITIVGKDREGIVASFTNFVFQQKGNVEKVNQNVIKELFGMYLEISFTKKINIKKFENELQKVAKKNKMDVSTHHEINSQKNIAIFVTKELHCLKVYLIQNEQLREKLVLLLEQKKVYHQ